MKTVEVWEGQGYRTGPVIDLELADNAGITAVSLTFRTVHGEAIAHIESASWDDPDDWQPLASAHVGPRGEETITAKVDRDSRELVRWSVGIQGRGPHYARFDTEERN